MKVFEIPCSGIMYGVAKSKIVLLFCFGLCMFYLKGITLLKHFPQKLGYFSCQSSELCLLTVIIKLFGVCFGLDSLVFIVINVTQFMGD